MKRIKRPRGGTKCISCEPSVSSLGLRSDAGITMPGQLLKHLDDSQSNTRLSWCTLSASGMGSVSHGRAS